MKSKILGSCAASRLASLRLFAVVGGLSLFVLTQAAGSVIHGPTPVPTNGSWIHFRWHAASVPVGDPVFSLDQPFTFTVPNGFIGKLDVTDFSLPGDQFRLTDAGSPLGDTSTPTHIDADESDPDVAFASTDWSSETFMLGAGAHSIDIEVIQFTTASGPVSGVTPPGSVTNGGGFLRVNLVAVPEPSLATWLLGVGLLVGLRRRR